MEASAKSNMVATPASASASAVPATFSLPSDATMRNAARLSITEDKPILLDYWTDSLQKKVFVGIRSVKRELSEEMVTEKMLVKSAEEYTSPIVKNYRVGEDYIVVTENSIYITSSKIEQRRIAS